MDIVRAQEVLRYVCIWHWVEVLEVNVVESVFGVTRTC